MLHEDHETSIILTKNAESQASTKYINVQHYYIRKLITNKEVKIEWICNTSMLVGGFTKALNANSFKLLQNLLGLTSWDN